MKKLRDIIVCIHDEAGNQKGEGYEVIQSLADSAFRCLDENPWMPIETAPKDGTNILLFYPKYDRKEWVGRYYRNETFSHGVLVRKSEGWHCDAGMSRLSVCVECDPTHWMSLPLHPTIP